MKTKLLRKIRKQYSIVYYPKGYKIYSDEIYHIGKYVVLSHWTDCFRIDRLPSFLNKQDAINLILQSVRITYNEYSRKYKKINNNGIKVWYV